jgi:hypothetical protein
MVYVDQAIWPWKGKKWCHLFSDSVEELHSFAEKMGLQREWFQDKRVPHYDLTESKRAIALKHGAMEATKEIIKSQFRRMACLYRSVKNAGILLVPADGDIKIGPKSL